MDLEFLVPSAWAHNLQIGGGGPTAKAKLVHPKDGGPQPVIGPWVPLAPIRSVSGHPTPFVAACLGIGQEATKTQLLQVIAESASFRC